MSQIVQRTWMWPQACLVSAVAVMSHLLFNTSCLISRQLKLHSVTIVEISH